jgi:hypothetical protein
VVRQIVARLLVREVTASGCRISITNGVPALRGKPRSPTLVARLTEHRTEVLDYLEGLKRGLCPVCKSDLIDPEDQERMAGVNFLCQVGPPIPPKFKNGSMVSRAVPGCPYRVQENPSVQP